MLSDALAHRAMLASGASAMSETFRAIGLHDAMYVIPALALVCAGVLFAASRTVTKDIKSITASPAGAAEAKLQPES